MTASDIGEFDGKVALVTGGASGIGAATARRLAGFGASVVVADRNGAGAEATARGIRDEGATGGGGGLRPDRREPGGRAVRHRR